MQLSQKKGVGLRGRNMEKTLWILVLFLAFLFTRLGFTTGLPSHQHPHPLSDPILDQLPCGQLQQTGGDTSQPMFGRACHGMVS